MSSPHTDPGLQQAAREICHGCELIDLHIDTMIPVRLWGFDPLTRGTRWPLGRHFFGQLDLPRATEGGLSAGMWSITTNPLRTAGGRWKAFQRNLEQLESLVKRSQGQMELVRDHAEYRAARERGAHAVLVSIQGGNALQAAPHGAASVPDRLLTRVTLVHMTHSVYGGTSLPYNLLRRKRGLTARGRELVEQLNQQRVFVDLAHIHPSAFWDAVEVHDPSQPLILTHTGACGVKPHWRNVDDDQLRAVAETGGVAGIIFHPPYLRPRGGSTGPALVVDHIEHVVKTVGEDHAAIGSDFDGAISPHPDLQSAERYPQLVEEMLRRGWSDERIQKILGKNFLRSWAHIRPGQ
jgi:membrane dipeptidase